jgi:hypothetical protein
MLPKVRDRENRNELLDKDQIRMLVRTGGDCDRAYVLSNRSGDRTDRLTRRAACRSHFSRSPS